jgi:hypothetical protein
MMTPLHPPKPRLVVRVGITGHRPNKLHGAAAARIGEQLPRLFAGIDKVAAEILAANSAWYASEPPMVRLVSGFAEGADQMAVAACPADWQVEAVLPFPLDEYLEDFEDSAPEGRRSPRYVFKELLKRASAITQLPFKPTESGDSDRTGDTGNRAKGYANAGRYLLRQVDVLIAVWDGKTPKTGGTGALARQAYEEGIPVVWLATLGDPTPHLIVRFEKDGRPKEGAADCTEGPLLEALKLVFNVPGAAEGREAKAPVHAHRFLEERWHPRCYCMVYDFLKQIASMKMPRLAVPFRSFAERCQEWDEFLNAAPVSSEPAYSGHDGGTLRSRVKSILLERFIWADTLAEFYAHSYRSAYVTVYLLSATAVFIALAGAVFEVAHYVELGVIVGILVIVGVGWWSHWHEQWIEYRELAENLRHGRFLAFVSEFGRIHATRGHSSNRGSSWIVWYLRATMREIGLPTAILNHTYQWRLLQATLQQEIKGQIRYHKSNNTIMDRIDRWLHRAGILCFIGVLCLLLMFMLGVTCLGGSLTFWTAGLPALGASLAGIRAQGDFEGSKERSARMLDALDALEDDYEKARDMTPDLSLSETSTLLISTARLMSEDVAAWQELYGRKWLSLPA